MKKTIVSILILLSMFCLCAYSFSELEGAAIKNNPSIRTAAQEVEKALLDYKDSKAGLTPTVDLTVTGSYLCNPIKPIRLNLGDYVSDSSSLNGFGRDYVTLYEGQEKTYYQFSLTATQPIFTWGKLIKATEIYNLVYEVRKLQYQDAIDKVSTELKTRIAALYYLEKLSDMLKSQQQISSRLVDLSESAVENGMMLESDFLGIKVRARQIDVAKAQIDRQLVQMETELKALTGLDIEGVSDFSEQDMMELAVEFENEGFESLSLDATSGSRTNFRILNLLIDISEKTKKVSALSQNWIPDLALVVSADYKGSRLPLLEKDWYGKDDWDATVTVALKTTVFDGGKAYRDYKRNTSNLEQADINVDDAVNQVTSALSDNFTNIGVCRAQLDYLSAMGEQLQAKADVQKSLMDSGYGPESDYLQVLLDKNNTEIDALQAKIELAASVFTVEYLRGFGFE